MKTKTSFKMYPAWAYEREIADLNERSRQGWQLVRGGCFRSKFAFDDGAVYRYALDFDQDIKDPVRYRETYAEQGWEFINDTFNGWHFFRKKYDPALPEEEYHIYTDEESVRQMESRWRRLLTTMGVIELAVSLLGLAMHLSEPPFDLAGLLIAVGGFYLGAAIIWGSRRVKSENHFLASGWVLVPPLVCFIAALGIAFL